MPNVLLHCYQLLCHASYDFKNHIHPHNTLPTAFSSQSYSTNSNHRSLAQVYASIGTTHLSEPHKRHDISWHAPIRIGQSLRAWLQKMIHLKHLKPRSAENRPAGAVMSGVQGSLFGIDSSLSAFTLQCPPYPATSRPTPLRERAGR